MSAPPTIAPPLHPVPSAPSDEEEDGDGSGCLATDLSPGGCSGLAATRRNISYTVEFYENERWFPVSGWCTKRLPTDRPHFSSKDGKVERDPIRWPLPEGYQWVGSWAVDKEHRQGTDRDGWRYAFTWGANFQSHPGPSTCVRRRRWIRTMIRVVPVPAAKATLNSDATAPEGTASVWNESFGVCSPATARTGGATPSLPSAATAAAQPTTSKAFPKATTTTVQQYPAATHVINSQPVVPSAAVETSTTQQTRPAEMASPQGTVVVVPPRPLATQAAEPPKPPTPTPDLPPVSEGPPSASDGVADLSSLEAQMPKLSWEPSATSRVTVVEPHDEQTEYFLERESTSSVIGRRRGEKALADAVDDGAWGDSNDCEVAPEDEEDAAFYGFGSKSNRSNPAAAGSLVQGPEGGEGGSAASPSDLEAYSFQRTVTEIVQEAERSEAEERSNGEGAGSTGMVPPPPISASGAHGGSDDDDVHALFSSVFQHFVREASSE